MNIFNRVKPWKRKPQSKWGDEAHTVRLEGPWSEGKGRP